ncbi:hypothetical protein BH23GEM9_BH23GEM9_07390 [soil metagenome]
MRLRIPVLALLLVAIASCGSDGPAGPNEPGGAVNGTFTARINGAAFSATFIVPAMTAGSVSAIGASAAGRSMAFAWLDEGPGTYVIGTAVGLNANLTMDGNMWTAVAGSGSGTLVVATRTANRITGTFTFTMNPPAGTSLGPRSVTDGAFDVTF